MTSIFPLARLKRVTLWYIILVGSMGFVLEIHAEEIRNGLVRCIIPQVWINIMNLLGHLNEDPKMLKEKGHVCSDRRHPDCQMSDS